MPLAASLGLMAVLLCLSAFFSMSETALFNLAPQTVARMRRSTGRGDRRIARLLDEPHKLLVTILFGNMVVNVLFYAIACTLAAGLIRNGAAAAGAGVSIGSLFAVIVFGEVSPKTLAVERSERIARAVAVPIGFVCRLLGPLVLMLEGFFTAFCRRLLKGRTNPPMEPEEFRTLIEETRHAGVINSKEKALIAEVLDLSEIKVREVMVPRVDLAMVPAGASRDEFLELARSTRKVTIPVYEETPDRIAGVLHLKRVLLEPERPLEELVEPVRFVPESQTIEALLLDFRDSGTRFAVVVDEYGGTEGAVTLEDVVEEIVGEITEEYETPEEPVREVAENEYLLAGNLSVRRWAELFGRSVEDTGINTLGGYVVRLLGHIPRPGSTVRSGNLIFTVERVKKRRVELVRVRYVEDSQT